MPIIEKYLKQNKAREEKEREEAGTPKEADESRGPTLKEILKNNEQSRLFGAYLEERGDYRLAERLAQGELGEVDLAQLSRCRREFVQVIEDTENISEKLSIKNIEEIIASSPDLRKIADLVGSGGIRDSLTRQLAEMAIRDPARVARISDQLTRLETARKEIAEKNKEIAEICEEYGISEDEYLKAIQSGNQKALSHIVRDTMGFWSKARLRRGGKKAVAEFWEEVDDLDKTSDIEAAIAKLNTEMEELGRVLQLTLIENKGTREGLVGQLQQEKPEKPDPEMSFAEMNGARKKDAVRKAWDEFQARNRDQYTQGGVYYEDEARQDFAYGYARETAKKKGGFWARLMSALLTPDTIKDFIKG